MIPGFHAVKESLLERAIKIQEIWIGEGRKGGRTDEVAGLAKERNIDVSVRRPEEFNRLAAGMNHQGFLAFAEGFSYVALEDLVRRLHGERGFRLLVAADHITDEGNLGALIRTAAFFGVQGLMLPKDRSARITGRVLKRTSGAFVFLPVVQVVNLRRALETMRGEGFWIVGASGEGGESIYDFDWRRDAVLVLGSEGKGLSRSVRDVCDAVVRIPRGGGVESLNVSVAGGVILGEIVRRRERGTPLGRLRPEAP